MNPTLRMLVKDMYQSLKPSYSSLTLEWLLEEADRQVKGEQPQQVTGMFLNRYLKEIGTIK